MMVGALVKALMLVRSDDVNSSKSNSRKERMVDGGGATGIAYRCGTMRFGCM